MSETGKTTGGKVAARAGVALLIFVGIGAALITADAQNRYLWIKALHVIAVISWMAGLLYMPRLFIYHLEQAVGSPSSETFKVMERRLMNIIMTPAMILTWTFGLWMAVEVYGFQGGWLHMKLMAVAALTVFHLYMGRAVRRFGRDERLGTTRAWRLMNEVPTLLMIVIVILVIVKPFA